MESTCGRPEQATQDIRTFPWLALARMYGYAPTVRGALCFCFFSCRCCSTAQGSATRTWKPSRWEPMKEYERARQRHPKAQLKLTASFCLFLPVSAAGEVKHIIFKGLDSMEAWTACAWGLHVGLDSKIVRPAYRCRRRSAHTATSFWPTR